MSRTQISDEKNDGNVHFLVHQCSNSVLMNHIKRFVRAHIFTLACIVLSLNVFIWFRGGLPVGFGDGGLQTMFYHPYYSLHQSLYAWNENQLGGTPNYSNVSLVPLDALASVIRMLHIPIFLQQALIWYLIELVGMLGCRAWLLRLFDDLPHSKALSFFGATFYVFNAMTALTYWFWDKLYITTVALVPILFLAIEIVFRQRLSRGIFALSAAVFVGSSLFLDGIFLVPVVVLCFIYSLVRILQLASDRQGLTVLAAKVLVASVCSAIANSWVILPFIASITSYYTNTNAQIDAAAALNNATSWSSWSGLVRFLPFGDQASGAWFYKLPTWRTVYSSIPFWLLSGLTLIVLGWGLAGKKARERRWLLAILFVLGLTIQAGAKGPIGSLLKWTLINVPFGHVLKTPWRSIAPVTLVGASGLFGLGLGEVRRRLIQASSVRTANAMVTIVLVLLCGVYVFPLWSGQIVSTPVRQRGAPISSYVSVPSAYSKVESFLSSQPGWFRVLGLPLSPTSYYTSQWPSGYDGADQRWLLFERPTISFTAGGAFPAVEPLQKFILKSSKVNFHLLMETAGQLSSKYIVVDGYMLTDRGGYYGQQLHSAEFYIQGFEDIGLKPLLTVGRLTIFKVPSTYFHPGLYAQSLGTEVAPVGESVKTVHLSPVESTMEFHNAGGTWLIVLGQNYDIRWTAVATEKVGLKTVKVHLNHVKVNNGFANAWLAKFPNTGRNVEVNIFYEPQRFIVFGLELSLISWVAIILLNILARVRYNRNL